MCGSQVVGSETNGSGLVFVPVYESEVLLAVRYVKVIIALLAEAAIAWERARVVRGLDYVLGVRILHGFVKSVIKRHWILVVDVQVGRIFVQEEAAGTPWRKRDCFLEMRVVLHVSAREYGIADIRV